MRRAGRPRIWHARRNNEMIVGVVAQGARLAVAAGVHVGRPAPSYLGHPLADRAHGCRDCDQRRGGRLSAATGDGHPPRGGYARSMRRRPTARRNSPPPACRAATASAASGASGTQKGTDVFVRRCAGCCRAFRMLRGGDRRDGPRSAAVSGRLQARLRRRDLADRIRFLGELPIDEVPRWYRRDQPLCLHLPQRGVRADAAGGHGGRKCGRGCAGRGCRRPSSRMARPGCWCRRAMPDALTAALERLMRDPEAGGGDGAAGARAGGGGFQPGGRSHAIVAVYRGLLG